MLYENPRLSDRELKYIWLKKQRVDHLSSCLASCPNQKFAVQARCYTPPSRNQT
jgi:hypothetical protein